MALMLPNTVPANCPPGERMIFERLKFDPGTEGWTVLHSLDIVAHPTQVSGEADFVVIVPGYGVLVLEIKSHTKVHVDERGWWLGADARPDERGPFKQASSCMHAIRNYLMALNPIYAATVFWSAVCFPRMPFAIKSPEWHPWQVIDRVRLASQPISSIVCGILTNGIDILQKKGIAAAGHQNKHCSREIAESVGRLLRPRFEQAVPLKSLRRDLDTDLAKFTEEQFSALDQLALNQRVIFSGPAGTGKTLLALETLRRAQRLYDPSRTAFFCYNRLLGKLIHAQAAKLCPGAVAGNIDAWLVNEVTPRPTEAETTEPEFWNGGLVTRAIDCLLADDCNSSRFDFVVLDEAQDLLQPHYVELIDLLLTGGLSAGRWRMFGDFCRQDIFTRGSVKLEEFHGARCPSAALFSFTVNCRNTTPISEYIVLLGRLRPPYAKVLRGDDRHDPHLAFYRTDQEQAAQVKTYIAELLASGFEPDDIVLLSPLASGALGEVLASDGEWKRRIGSYGGAEIGRIRYTTIQKFKGLEAPVIILTDFSRLADDHAASLFYIGLSRALHRLGIFLHVDLKAHVRSIT